MLNYLRTQRLTTKLNVNMISALNQFDLTKAVNNQTTIFEIKFKNSTLVNKNLNNTTLTMAYLMIDKEEDANELSPSLFNVKIKQHLISQSEPKLSSEIDLFQLNQMRNGLYSISLSNRDFIETFLSENDDDDEEKFDLKLEFSIKTNREEKLSFLLIKDLSLSKNFTLKSLSSNVLRKMNINEYDDTNDVFYLKQKNNNTDSKTINSNNNSLNLFNSVIIITTASIILVIFGITCFIVSISLYITSKCRLLNKLKTTTTTGKKTTNGTNTNNLSFYSQHLSSSSSSSSSSPRVTNTQTNVSPATSIMTSLEIIQKSTSTSLGSSSSSSSSSLRSNSKKNATNTTQQNDRQLIICLSYVIVYLVFTK